MKRIVFVITLLILVVAPAAYAQDGDPLKNQLIELINQLGPIGVSLIAGFTSTLASGLTNFIRHLSFLSDEEKSKISGLGADLLNVVSSLAVSLLMVGIARLAGLVDTLTTQDLLQVVTVLTGATAGGSSLVVHKLNKALSKK